MGKPALNNCAECAGQLDIISRTSLLARSLHRPICRRCRRSLHVQFAAALALLGLGVALSPVIVDMPAGLFVALGLGLVLFAGVVYWRRTNSLSLREGESFPEGPSGRGEGERILQREADPHQAGMPGALGAPRSEGERHLPNYADPHPSPLPAAGRGNWSRAPLSPAIGRGNWRRLVEDPQARFYAAIFGPWLAAYYVANLACGEWNPLAVGCNDTCKAIMWGSLGSMVILAAAYLRGYRKASWLMLGVMVIQNFPHCRCDNGLFIAALGVQPLCMIVPTGVGLTNLWMMSIGRFKPYGFALTLSLLAGAFAVAVTHRLGIQIMFRAIGTQLSVVGLCLPIVGVTA